MDYLNFMTEWLASYSPILIGIGSLSILILIFSIIGLGWFISQIPEDYFIHENRQADNWDKYSSETKVVIVIIKNVIGIVMLISGLLLLILPGQGILTMIIGILLIDYPGKFKLEQKIIAIPSVFRSLNWFRAKSKKSYLQHPFKKY
jgi:archaellum biogenesis protein FlaJ (TadC family)